MFWFDLTFSLNITLHIFHHHFADLIFSQLIYVHRGQKILDWQKGTCNSPVMSSNLGLEFQFSHEPVNLTIISGRRPLISLCLTNDHWLRRHSQVNYSCPVSRPVSLRTVTLHCSHWARSFSLTSALWDSQEATERVRLHSSWCSQGRPSSVMQIAEHCPHCCRLSITFNILLRGLFFLIMNWL